MATLVLTTVGTLVGGPIGGAIGALIGGAVDQRLFAPKGRQGPRLGELSVQTSTYGSAIPKLFGTMRVAGTVIWATDLIEDKHKSGGGKGQPKTTSYSYSVSFAVALSGRQIRSVGRIWADGKLLRGAAGDWKSETGFRLHLGGEDAAVDPLIAAAEGAGLAPAYRGIAYALFEEMQLADFGNRIPSLTFEVEADAGPVTVAAIAAALSDGALAGTTTAAVGGYAASGDSVRGAIETLAQALPLSIGDDGARLILSDAAADPVPIAAAALGAGAGEHSERIKLERRAAGALPDEIMVSHYAPERDYQTGLQRAWRGAPARRSETIELPAALAAGAAKAIAEARLAASWAERATAEIGLPWRSAELRPGGAVTLPDGGGSWRIAGWALEQMVVKLKLVGRSGAGAAVAASPGRSTGGADAPHGGTVLALMDLPALEDSPPAVPRLWIAAAGVLPGWRRAALSISLDGEASWRAIGGTAPAAVMGAAATALAAGSASLLDETASVEIELLHEAMALAGRDDIAADATANFALLGDELIQFAAATQLTATRWRLARLLRGRRGTEHAIAGHGVGDRFVLLEAETMIAFDPPTAAIGGPVALMASGIGDTIPAEDGLTLIGRALRPPAPAQLRAAASGGDVAIAWTRRSRAGWRWLDGGDAPLAEESERYRIDIRDADGAGRTAETAAAALRYTAAEQAADGVAGPLAIAVAQIGAGGGSLPPARILFTGA